MKHIILPKGFSAAGISAGIKSDDKKDMALLVSDVPAVPAGVFTTNQIKAAPVKWDMKVVKDDVAQAIVINSGNANACTGQQGIADTHAMASLTAGLLETTPEQIFVCSTGTIGKPLPMEKIIDGIEDLAEALSPENGMDAAEAILTTDLVTKTITTEIGIDETPVRLTGIAKGSGMIEPNMATMLAFILTDAHIDKQTLQCALRASTDSSFNRITVDGDQSTNDSVIALANGKAGNALLNEDSKDWDLFSKTLQEMLFELAMMIMRDGEGVTKLVTVQVQGAASDGEANEAAQAVANSNLNKTAWKGTRPNWGRVVDAIGYSHAQVVEEKIDVSYGDVPAVRGGTVYSEYCEADAVAVVSKNEFTININLNIGDGEATVYSCDFTEDYVRINEV
jgi:glutamate N-acetyltransferase / amino-acid N-acetyltransferase